MLARDSFQNLGSHTDGTPIPLPKRHAIGENSQEMGDWLGQAGNRYRVGLGLAAVILSLGAEGALESRALPSKQAKEQAADAAPEKRGAAWPSPAFTIPVEPLGFYAPNSFYTGLRESLVSLDFIDENRLLFTFRAPGLIRRSGGAGEEERQIRAEVLSLPQGVAESEALWTLHDHDRYLWMLHSGHFLLRDQDTLKEGDAHLELRSLLQFPGPLLSLEMDPGQKFLVTNSQEPSETTAKKGEVESPATASASVSTDISGAAGDRDIVLRILERNSGRVMLVSRVRSTIRLPLNSEGYVETLRGNGQNWILDLDFFTGGSRVLGKLESSCQPPVQFLSHEEAVANTCLPNEGRRLVALSTEGQRLWDAVSPPTQVWPLLVIAPDGSRLARETLTLDHPIGELGHILDVQNIKGQLVEVFDAIGGSLVLKTPVTPVLDGGGNVAISPSGKRVAILNGGAIEVYELPPPKTAALPAPAR